MWPLPHDGSPSWNQPAEEKAGQVKVCKIDIDENPELAMQFGVMSIPTLIVFKDGAVANKSVGRSPRPLWKSC